MNSIFEKEEIVCIQGSIDNQHQANIVLLDKLKHGDVSEEDLRLLMDIVSNDFSRSGLDDNDEPNKYGLKLEAIIDKLSARNEG